MNDIKQELIKAAGNIERHKKRVIENVERKITLKKPKGSKWLPVALSGILIAALLLFMPKLLEQEQQTSSVILDLEYLNISTAIYEGYWDNEEMGKNDATREYILDSAMYAYAQDNGVTVSKTEIEEAISQYFTYTPEEQVRPILENTLKKHGYTWKDYEHYIKKHVAKMNALEQKLLEPYKAAYPSFGSGTHQTLLQFTVEDHLQTNHEEVFQYFQQQFDYAPAINNIEKGVVLAVTDEAILVSSAYVTQSQKSTVEWRLEDGQAMSWIPKRDTMPAVQVGDRLSIVAGAHTNTDSEDAVYKSITYAHSFEIIDDTVSIIVPQPMPKLNTTWESIKRETSEPMYKLKFKDRTLLAWLSTDRTQLELYDNQTHEQTKISLSKLQELLKDTQ